MYNSHLEVEARLPEVWRVPLAQLDHLLHLVLRVGLHDMLARRHVAEHALPVLAAVVAMAVAVHLGQTDSRLLAAQLGVVALGGPGNIRVAPPLALLLGLEAGLEVLVHVGVGVALICVL